MGFSGKILHHSKLQPPQQFIWCGPSSPSSRGGSGRFCASIWLQEAAYASFAKASQQPSGRTQGLECALGVYICSKYMIWADTAKATMTASTGLETSVVCGCTAGQTPFRLQLMHYGMLKPCMRCLLCSHWLPMVIRMLLRAAFNKGRFISVMKMVSQTALALSEFLMLCKEHHEST